MANRWKQVADALARLARDQAGKPEGELARQKLAQIMARYPQARERPAVQAFMLRDLGRMRRLGVSTDGRWTGRNLEEAVALMAADYRQRLAEAEDRLRRRGLPGCLALGAPAPFPEVEPN